MNNHSRKIYDAITGPRAPRDLEWTQFVRFWEDVGDDVEQESGDRIAVHVNGRRVVFRRPHDGRVTLDDIEHARQLLADTPGDPESAGKNSLVVVAIDDERARILNFDLDAARTTDTARTVRDEQANSRHLRTVEKQTGRDDAQELSEFFDQVADALTALPNSEPMVVLGHGKGKASAATQFVERLEKKHSALAHRLRGVGEVDLSAATDTDLEKAARSVATRG